MQRNLSKVLGLGLAVAVTGLTAPAVGQTGGAGGGLGGPGVIELPSALGTRVVATVELRLEGSTGDPDRDEALLAQARRRVRLQAGDRLSRPLLGQLYLTLVDLPGVRDVRTEVVGVSGQVQRARVVFVLLLGEGDRDATGMLTTEGVGGFPYLYRGDTGSLRFIVNGGHGFFTDGDPWFGDAPAFTSGNPLVQDPSVGADTGDRATWVESWIELGIGGVEQLGRSNSAVYGAATVIGVGARGEDIFRDDDRETLDVEKLYAGFLAATDDRSRKLDLSAGRLNFTLNDGFLISQFGSQYNAGPRPGIYLAPRTTHDFATVATVEVDNWTGTGFYLNPNEYEPLETDTQLAGLNLRHNFTDRFYADASYIHAVDSNTRYSDPDGQIGTRDGLETYAGHVRWAGDADREHGLWLESELAHQRHSDFDMDAWAGYGTLGYIARDAPWTPSISYRYSALTGDDPTTDTYERFDSLFSGGLDQWLQGISLGKVVRPENRLSHRIRLNVAPTRRLNLTLDYFLHRADELNNIGANPAISQLASHDLGQELQLVARWAISERLYFLGVASVGFPGDALDAAAGGDAENWTTLQAQLFWTF